jgi:hypothetical protein
MKYAVRTVIFVGLILAPSSFGSSEEMSGTSFSASRSKQQGTLPLWAFSIGLRAGLLGLGLVAVRRVVPFTR